MHRYKRRLGWNVSMKWSTTLHIPPAGSPTENYQGHLGSMLEDHKQFSVPVIIGTGVRFVRIVIWILKRDSSLKTYIARVILV